MNYLGHLALAENNDESRIGHYLGDFVKGGKAAISKQYPELIVKGIIAHRKIDIFTDAHPAVYRAVTLLKADSGRFAAIIVDVIFDYYLIKHWKRFFSEDFERFVRKCYNSLEIIVADELYPAPKWVKTMGPSKTNHATKGIRKEILWTNYDPQEQKGLFE